jgi:hypothetical protein
VRGDRVKKRLHRGGAETRRRERIGGVGSWELGVRSQKYGADDY